MSNEMKKVGRPKMTEEQKAFAKAQRMAEKAQKEVVSKSQQDNDATFQQFDLSDFKGGFGYNGQEPKKEKMTSNIPSLPGKNVTSNVKEYAAELLKGDARIVMDNIKKFSKGEFAIVEGFTTDEARMLVDTYYSIQKQRIELGNQKNAMVREYIKDNKLDVKAKDVDIDQEIPRMQVINMVYNNVLGIETEIKKALDHWTDRNEVGTWLKQIIGIGPVLSAALISYFDIERARSVSHFYSYCGLNKNNTPWLGKEKATQLVNKYTSKIKRIGLTLYEIENAVAQLRDENIGQDIEDINDIAKNPENIVKYADIYAYAKEHAINHSAKDEISDEEIALIANDKSHGRLAAKLVQMAYDPEKKLYSKKKLKKELSKPPYNQTLQMILFLVGESFVKVSYKEDSLYGRLYKERKAEQTQKNMNFEYADQAAKALREKNYGKDTEAYKAYIEGMLPPAQIHARARQYAVKILVSHLYDQMYICKYNAQPPRHYVEVYMEHNDIIGPEVPYKAIDPSLPQGRPIAPVKQY